jgi:DeoR/GlpR family transcriptional regulator of sugar metabolism
MLVAERHQKILDILDQRGSIRVSELSHILGVTEETIRRDLGKLEGEGKLLRSHGGAVKIQVDQEIPYFKREKQHVEEKIAIAKEAVKYVNSGERIILDASTTAWFMAKNLPDIPLTVLTNSIKVATELANKEKINVISTGGILLPKSLSFVGPLAEQSLNMYRVNKAFISCKGLDFSFGISDSNELGALVKRKMISIADTTFLLIDHSKFGVHAFIHLADLKNIDRIITDSKTDQTYIEELKEYSVDVLQVK